MIFHETHAWLLLAVVEEEKKTNIFLQTHLLLSALWRAANGSHRSSSWALEGRRPTLLHFKPRVLQEARAIDLAVVNGVLTPWIRDHAVQR